MLSSNRLLTSVCAQVCAEALCIARDGLTAVIPAPKGETQQLHFDEATVPLQQKALSNAVHVDQVTL